MINIKCRNNRFLMTYIKSLPLLLIFLLNSTGTYAFSYNSYEHFSFANCSLDTTYFPSTIFCDIPTGDEGRTPKNMTGLVFYSDQYAGDVDVCVKHLGNGLTMCQSKEVTPGNSVVFETSDLSFNWSAATRWGGNSEWWNWVVNISLPGTDMSPATALRGYRVFYKIP